MRMLSESPAIVTHCLCYLSC